MIMLTALGFASILRADTLTVVNTLDKGSGSLRAAIAGAHNGDVIVFDSGLVGQTITLASGALDMKQDITIQGLGAEQLAISGGDVSRVLDVAEGATVTISGLTITHGRSRGSNWDRGGGGGGGILNAGNLSVVSVAFAQNVSLNHGGAIANGPSAILTVRDCTFMDNQAVSKDPLAITEGGAIYSSNRRSVATITGSTFRNNQAFGGDNGEGSGSSWVLVGQANGGAIHNGGTSLLVVEDSSFIGNESRGGNRGNVANAAFGNAGGAIGGAIANDENCDAGAVIVRRCSFVDNRAIAGDNNTGSLNGFGYVATAGGGAIYQGGVGAISDSTFIGNQALGGRNNTGGAGVLTLGAGLGGAINNAYVGFCITEATISGCAFTDNRAIGGDGNAGGILTGAGVGGVLINSEGSAATVLNCVLSGNAALGGAPTGGGIGGAALGGGISSGQPPYVGSGSVPTALTMRGTTITLNTSIAGAGGMGAGGGVYLSAGTACRDAATSIVGNTASTFGNDVFGVLPICP